MRLIDTHCHLTNSRLGSDLGGIVDRCHQAGVVACICASATLAESAASAALARAVSAGLQGRQPLACYCTAGIHPHEAKDVPGGYLDSLTKLAAEPRCVAMGEMGLDYHYDFSPRDAQRRVFAEQLDLARRLAKPIMIHTREAFDDTVGIIRESGVDGARIVFHSFTHGPTEARVILDMGAMVSFSGIVTFKNAQALRDGCLLVGDDRLLIETDSPYLSPEPVRTMRNNEPANVAHVAAMLAQLRRAPAERLAELTTANAVRFFGLGCL